MSQTAPTSTTFHALLERPVEAYRYLFAIGAVYSVVGTVMWIMFALQMISYPGTLHPMVMSGGFLLSFAYGFLWTALPRFTQSAVPSFRELSPLLAAQIIGLGSAACGEEVLSLLCFLVANLLTVRFAITRFRTRKNNPPDSFFFVGIALILGGLSIATLIVSRFIELPMPLVIAARVFFLRDMIFFMVLGVGFRLIPAILGVAAPQKLEVVQANPSLTTKLSRTLNSHAWNALILILFAFSLIAESFGEIRVAAACTFLACVLAILRGFQWRSMPTWSNRLAWFVWMSVAFMNAGPAAVLVFPIYAVHLWHLSFIGGLGLMTLMVATRVAVSHSGEYKPYVEERRRFVPWIGIIILITALTRASIAWTPQQATTHYVYAACFWLISIGIWFVYFLRYTIPAERRVIAALQQTVVAL